MPVVEHAPPQSKGRSGEDAVPNAARASTPCPAYPCFRGLRLPARCCTCVAVLAWRCEMCVPGGHEDSMTRLGSKIENHVHGKWRRVPVRSGFSRRGGREPSLRSDRNLVRFYTLFTIRVRPREETVRWHTRAHLICLTILTAATLCCTSPPRLATCIRASHTLPHTGLAAEPAAAGGGASSRASEDVPPVLAAGQASESGAELHLQKPFSGPPPSHASAKVASRTYCSFPPFPGGASPPLDIVVSTRAVRCPGKSRPGSRRGGWRRAARRR